MSQLEGYLSEYIKNLEANKSPKYSLLKDLLLKLEKPGDEDISRILSKSFRDKYHLLDQVVKSQKVMSAKDKRHPIEQERRGRMATDRKWYISTNTDISPGERQTTELICAVHSIYYLLFRCDVSKTVFSEFFKLDESDVFGLAKLITAFTSDFKILEIYLRFAEQGQVDKLKASMLKYLDTIHLDKEKYTSTECMKFEELVILFSDAKLIKEKVQSVYEHFEGYDFELTGTLHAICRDMSFVGMVCKNVDELEKRSDLNIRKRELLGCFAKNLDGVPFVLAKTCELIERGTKAYNSERYRDENVSKYKRNTTENEHANSIKFLTLMLPILRFVIDNCLGDFESSKLREKAKIIDSKEKGRYYSVQDYLSKYQREDRVHHEKLIKYFEFLKNSQSSAENC